MKRCLAVLIVFATSLPLLGQEEGAGPAKGAQVDTTGKGYSAAYVIETGTKRVLFEENAHLSLPTASMAKMMTLLIVMDRVQDGELKLDTPVQISARASKMGGSQIFAKEGQAFPVQTLIAATMIHSANDAATALAEKVAGSVEGFADLMNDKARQLGLTESKFVDPHGLPPSSPGAPQDTQSAHDLAIVGMEVMKHSLLRDYAKTATMPFTNATFTSGLANPNHLINPGKRDYMSDATGIKTGFSAPAGYCVTASAKRGDLELVCVIMGARAPMGPQSSFGIAARLMNEEFSRWRMLQVVKKGAVVGQAPISEGQAKSVPAVAGSDVKALVQRGQEGGVKTSLSANTVTAPVTAGQQVGTVVVMQGGQQINRVPAVAGASVEKQSWWKKFWPF